MTQLKTTYNIDMSRLLGLANKEFGKAVDADMLGNPITDASVLMHGAYGPAVARLINLAVQRHGGKPRDEFGRDELVALAPEAFAQAVDKDFGGNILTDYSLVLETSYGFGPTTLNLVRLAIQRADELGLPCTVEAS